MTTYDDPNREAVGLAPIWTGGAPGTEAAAVFDPGAHTVTEVNDYIAAHPEDADRVLAAEAAGKARVSIIGEA